MHRLPCGREMFRQLLYVKERRRDGSDIRRQ